MNTRYLVAILIVVVLGLVWFFGFSSRSSPGVSGGQKQFTLVVADKKLSEGPTVLSAKEGDTVVIHIQSDEAEEFHLHGYDRAVDLEAGKTATLTLVANASGRFPYELEHAKIELGALEVYP